MRWYEGMWEKMLSIGGNEDCFIETGTYMGSTANWATSFWPKVITIEAHEGTYKSLQKNLNSKVDSHLGKSKDVFEKLSLPQKCFFWLDAHYSGSSSDPCSDENFFWDGNHPLLEELLYILSKNFNGSIVCIDDWDQVENGYQYMPSENQVKELIGERKLTIVTYFNDADVNREMKIAYFKL